MHPELLGLLACPDCRGDLSVEGPHSTPAEGLLRCHGCGRCFPIRNGIPRFVDNDSSDPVAAQFELEFSALKKDDMDMDPYALREYFFFSRTGLDPNVHEAIPGDPYRTSLPEGAYRPHGKKLSRQFVLDAGCGPGRFTEVAASHGSRLVVGLDLGVHVERAAQRCAHMSNVAFVQGSVLSPPFKDEAFGVAFSIGVLHHTGSPEDGARAVAKTVAPGGLMSLWVYPPEYWGRGLQRLVTRAIHRLLSRQEPEIALRYCMRWLFPLGKVQMKVHPSRFLRYLLAPLFLVKVPRHPRREVMLATIFDYYAPTHISTHEPCEVATWLAGSGFVNVRTLPVLSSAIGVKGLSRDLRPKLAVSNSTN
jgi:uncharacterized protein YbaR (Trm112 family)/ubiquinone/menaquinone biosynthesis C-methylase UbiE